MAEHPLVKSPTAVMAKVQPQLVQQPKERSAICITGLPGPVHVGSVGNVCGRGGGVAIPHRYPDGVVSKRQILRHRLLERGAHCRPPALTVKYGYSVDVPWAAPSSYYSYGLSRLALTTPCVWRLFMTVYLWDRVIAFS